MKHLSMTLGYCENSADTFYILRGEGKEQSLSIFLDSCFDQKQSTSGKDLIAVNPEFVFEGHENKYTLRDGNYQVIERGELALEKLLELEKIYSGNILGYLGYHSKDEHFKIPRHNEEVIPDITLGFFPWLLEVNHSERKSTLIYRENLENIDSIVNKLQSAREKTSQPQNITEYLFTSNLGFNEYENAFTQIKQHILDGDCYQINLAQRFECNFTEDSWLHYLHLRTKSPAPYSAFISSPYFDILSFSPESFLHVSPTGKITSQPIKGTRKRSHNKEHDKELKNELSNSEKDKAENLMIVDLIRNDLSQSAEFNSVKVDALFSIQSFSNVHHMISTVSAQKEQGLSNFSVLLNAFPGGSITGAPKKSAMEVIRDLEPHARQIYCGAIGYCNAQGEMEFNIAIRTILIHKNKLYCWGGGGLVADSECNSEYQESINKINNLISTENPEDV